MDIPSKNKPAAGRYALLDELRGLDLLSMIGYHACWDLIFLFGMSAAWYTGWQGHLWQQSICWVFILLSGFCLPLGHRPLRRGLIVSGAGVLVTVLLIVETFHLLLPGLWSAFSAGDEQALSEYLASQGRLRSFLTLWFLAVVQVLSLVIPAMPVQLAAGLAYGPWMGFLTSCSASAVANMSVYLIARRLVPVIRRLVADNPKAAKLLDSVRSSKDPWFYTILAFITPGLPNGIIPYAAANAGMRPKQFLAAIFISLPFPTLLTCAAGSFMLEGNWLFTVLTGIVLFSFVGILFFNRTKFIAWAHEVKNRHTQKAGA